MYPLMMPLLQCLLKAVPGMSAYDLEERENVGLEDLGAHASDVR